MGWVLKTAGIVAGAALAASALGARAQDFDLWRRRRWRLDKDQSTGRACTSRRTGTLLYHPGLPFAL